MEGKELRECPFCGGEARILHDGGRTGGMRTNGPQILTVQCGNCLATTEFENNRTHLKVKNYWNNRAADSALDAVLEDFKKWSNEQQESFPYKNDYSEGYEVALRSAEDALKQIIKSQKVAK